MSKPETDPPPMPTDHTGLTAQDVPLQDVLAYQRQANSPDEVWTPALPTLRAQQSGLRDDLMDGFGDRQELLLWVHAAAAVSMGTTPDRFAITMVNTRWRVAACLKHPKQRRELVGDHAAPTEQEVKNERQDIIHSPLSPAFQEALRVASSIAADYTDLEDGVEGTHRQRFLAMRPRMHQLAVAQHEALCWALGRSDRQPLTDRRSVQEWVDYCGYACSGRLPQAVHAQATNPTSDWYGALLDGRDAASEHLVSLLAMDVLPAMTRALRQAASDSEENPRVIDDSADVDPRPTEAF